MFLKNTKRIAQELIRKVFKMQPTKVSHNCISIIKFHEGFRSRAYLCPAGVPTIGWGSTKIFGRPVDMHLTITMEQADAQLEKDVEKFSSQVLSVVKVPLTQNQFDALVSFTYNLGIGNLQKSTLLKKLNAGDYEGAANEFEKWVKSGGRTLNGLVTRRKQERDLFLGVMPTESP